MSAMEEDVSMGNSLDGVMEESASYASSEGFSDGLSDEEDTPYMEDPSDNEEVEEGDAGTAMRHEVEGGMDVDDEARDSDSEDDDDGRDDVDVETEIGLDELNDLVTGKDIHMYAKQLGHIPKYKEYLARKKHAQYQHNIMPMIPNELLNGRFPSSS